MVDSERFSVDAARQAADAGRLDEWVAEFLSSPGSDNAELAEQLTGRPRWWLGPLRLPFDQLHRLAGPAGDPVLRVVDEDDWRDDIDDLAEEVEEGWQPPPLIVTFRDEQLVLEDGNHRVEGMRRAGERDAWAVVGFDDPADRDRFSP